MTPKDIQNEKEQQRYVIKKKRIISKISKKINTIHVTPSRRDK